MQIRRSKDLILSYSTKIKANLKSLEELLNQGHQLLQQSELKDPNTHLKDQCT